MPAGPFYSGLYCHGKMPLITQLVRASLHMRSPKTLRPRTPVYVQARPEVLGRHRHQVPRQRAFNHYQCHHSAPPAYPMGHFVQ